MKSSGKKEKLILGQKKDTKEQMTFSDPGSRPHPDVETDLSTKNTPFDKVDFPNPTEEHSNYEELLASEEYKDALNKLARYTGARNIGVGTRGTYGQLSNNAYRILNEIMRSETNHEQELEDLCERIVRDHFKIPEDALSFNFKLVKESIKINNTPSKQQLKQQEEELADDINDLTPERAKRRLMNAMTQGHAVDSTYIFEKVRRELQQITGVNNIVEKYDIFVSTMMLGYWQFSNEMLMSTMGGGGGEGSGAGKTRVDRNTDPPTINAEAMIFPFLIHEAIKGVMEFLSIEKEPENESRSERAMDLEDQIVHEVWDIRLGPAIWRRLISLFPNAIVEDEDKKKLQYYMYNNIANLPVKEFLIFMKEVVGKTEDGKNLIGAMYYDLTMVLDDEDPENHFKSKMDEVMRKYPDFDNNDINDLIQDWGFRLS